MDKNRKVEKRTFLSSQEVSQLLAAAKKSRYPLRDQALILLTFRHGLRASEAVNLSWDQIDMKGHTVHVSRLKGSDPSIHTLEADEHKLLKRLKEGQSDTRFIFMTERGTVMTADGFLKLLKKLGQDAGFAFNVHPHMLRHGAGHALAMNNASTRSIQHYLGHKNIKNVVRYTQMNDKAFQGYGAIIGGKVK